MTVFFSASFALANTEIQIQAELQLPSHGQTIPAQLTVGIADDPQSAKENVRELLQRANANPEHTHIAFGTALTEQEFSKEFPEFQHTNSSAPDYDIYKNIAYFNVDGDNPVDVNDTVTSLTFAILQTGVNAYVFFFVSDMKTVVKTVSTVYSGVLNLYFSFLPERWDQYQQRGRNLIGRILRGVGADHLTQSKWFNPLAKSATGAVGTVAFITVANGVRLWDQYLAQFLTSTTAFNIGVSTLVSFLVSQPWDTTLGNWLEKGHKYLSERQVKFLIRSKSLIMAAVSPLVFLQYEPAFYVAGGIGVGGITMMVAGDQISDQIYKFNITARSLKNKMAEFFRNGMSSTKEFCKLMLKKFK